MKKILMFISLIFLVAGCGIDAFKEDETLIKKAVNSYLGEYQALTINVMIPLGFDMDDMEFFSEESRQYYELAIKRQYQDITYKVTTVSVYSESATAKVEIYTYDFVATEEAAKTYVEGDGAYIIEDEDENIQKLLFENYLYQQMYEEDTRIKQEIIISLSKEKNKWEVNKVDNNTLLKIRGLFE